MIDIYNKIKIFIAIGLKMQTHSLQKFAFTLAEVLITLGIIGVIAAMTMPGLVLKIRQQQNVTAWKKIYSESAQALKSMEADNIVTSALSVSQPDREYEYATLLSRYMKLGQVCHANRGVEEGCFPKRSPIYALDGRVLNASGWDKLAGGAACASLLNGGIMCFDSYILVVDVNGYAPPNKVGADIFAALVDFENYSINPAKGYRTMWGAADDVLIKTTVGDGTCNDSDYGWGCSYYYLHNKP